MEGSEQEPRLGDLGPDPVGIDEVTSGPPEIGLEPDGPSATAGPEVANSVEPATAAPYAKPTTPAPEAKLELDLASVKRLDQSELTGAALGGSAHASASASGSHVRVYGAVSPEPGRMLGSDPIGALLMGLAIGVAVGLLPALVTTRGVTAERLLPLEDELAESLSRSAEVERGRLRSPASIESQLDSARSETKRRFLLVWLGTGLPLGLLLGRLRR